MKSNDAFPSKYLSQKDLLEPATVTIKNVEMESIKGDDGEGGEMTEQEALARMIAPGTKRPGKLGGYGGVIQIHVTRACNLACFNCTQGSQLGGKTGFMTPEQFEQAVRSLDGYFGVVGVFGGNPATSPYFDAYCDILRELVPFERRGLWCNHPLEHGRKMRETFDPRVSNLNVHLDRAAHAEFKRDWPESMPFGLTQDSRHSPPFVAMRDVLKKDCADCCNGYQFVGAGPESDAEEMNVCRTCDGTGRVYDEALAWELISGCDINQHWSAMIGVFRGQLRAWFCEIAGAQSILHQDEPDYPDTGIPIPYVGLELACENRRWWELPMVYFKGQVRKHCHDCGVPLRGHGELAQASSAEAKEQVSAMHQGVYKPKRKYRKVELVVLREQLGAPLKTMTHYLQNAKVK